MTRADIRSREWVAQRLAEGTTVTAIATEAGVSRQTAHTWLHRHQLEPEPRTKPRPDRDELAALYALHRSTAAVADQLGIGADTARRWLIAAGIELASVGKPSIILDRTRLLERRSQGATVAELAEEFGVGPKTIYRCLTAAGAEPGTRGRSRITVDPAKLRQRRNQGATLAELALEFGVAPETIRRRLNNESQSDRRQ